MSSHVPLSFNLKSKSPRRYMMELRKFYADDMQAGLELVRAELGEGAVILDTRSINDTGPDGQPCERVEIWAYSSGDGAPLPDAVPDAQPEELPLVPDVLPVMPASSLTGADSSDDLALQVQDLQSQLQTLHYRLESFTENMNWLGTGSLENNSELTACIADSLAGKLPTSGGIRLGDGQHVVALIGPTGVGKTSMVGKLAWAFAVQQDVSVGVITTDTLRIGALDQIRLICGHLDVPLEVVYQPAEMAEALERLSSCALVLLDTPGGSPRQTDYLEDVRQFLLAADPMEVHLVLSAVSGAAAIRDIIQRTTVLHPDQVIFTKLDEALSLVEIFPIILGSGLAVSYLGAGPAIARDLQVASGEIISQLIIAK